MKIQKKYIAFIIGGVVLMLSALLPSSHMSAFAPTENRVTKITQPSNVAESLATTSQVLVKTSMAEASKSAIKKSAPKNQVATVSIKTENTLNPVRLVIPKIGVNAQIRAMGLTSQGKMDVPNNFTDVGWYSLGTNPGQIGSAVMGAHVDNGSSVSGVFKNLKSLVVGDIIQVLGLDGSRMQFVVTQRKIYSRSETNTDEVFLSQGAARLNLITCYGTWLPRENTYSDRLVVFTEKV